jgi:enoyl-CoA hydratase/carnithine racemase
MSDHRLLIEHELDGQVAVATLNRPEKHNALDRPMFDAIDAAIDQLKVRAAAGEIRAVVVRGAGKSFCSGLDIAAIVGGGEDFGSSTEALLERREGDIGNLVQRICYGWRDIGVPVIAAVHGNCLGGGLQIALGADIRIATPDAKLAVAEVRWGLIPDMAITLALPRLIGIDHAKELTFTGRNTTGEDAERIGLVTHLASDPYAAALTLAEEICTRLPAPVNQAKLLLDEAWDQDDAGRLATEERLQRELLARLAAAAAGQA